MLCVGDTKYKIHIGSNSYKIATPYDYEVLWLERAGHQYIDTGVPASNKITRVSVEVFDLLKQSRFIYGAQRSNVRDYLFIWGSNVEIHTRANSNNNIVRFTLTEGSDYELSYTSKDDSTTQREGLTYNGTFLPNRGNYTMDFDNLNLFLFANNFNGVVDFSDGNGMARLRLGKVKIWRNNVLVRDFIPVVKNGIGYMFDKVEMKLYGNLGEGQFGFIPESARKHQLEWIARRGGRLYINTLVPASEASAIEVKVVDYNSACESIVGCRYSANASKFGIMSPADVTNGNIRFDYGDGANLQTNITTGQDYVFKIDGGKFYINGVKVGESSPTGTERDLHIFLFAYNLNGSASSTANNNVLKIAYCKIWNKNGNLIRNLVPYQLGDYICMYDEVNRRYYYDCGSSGTSFIAGPEL